MSSFPGVILSWFEFTAYFSRQATVGSIVRRESHVYRAPCVVYFVFVQNCLKHKANVVTQQKRSLYNDKVIAWPLFCLAAEALFHNAQVHWKLGTPTSDRTAQVGARKLLWRETERRQREREKYI